MQKNKGRRNSMIFGIPIYSNTWNIWKDSKHKANQNSPCGLRWLISSKCMYIISPSHLWKSTIRHICPCLFTCKHILLFIQIKWNKQKHVAWYFHSRYSINYSVIIKEKYFYNEVTKQYPTDMEMKCTCL